jgi:hypothetical protein
MFRDCSFYNDGQWCSVHGVHGENHIYILGVFAVIDTDLGISDVLGSSGELGTLGHCHLSSKRKYSVYDLHCGTGRPCTWDVSLEFAFTAI